MWARSIVRWMEGTRQGRDMVEQPATRRRLLESSAGTLTTGFGIAEWALLASIALIWGSSFLLIDVGLESLQPGVVSLARVALGASALALLPAARAPVDRSDLPRIALFGATGMGIPLLLFPIAQQWVDSSVAGMVNGAMPIMTAAWSALLLSRLPRARQRWGIIIGFAGVVAICAPGLGGADGTTLGLVLLVAAVLLYGLATNIAVPLQQRYGTLPVVVRAQLAAVIVVAPFGLAQLGGSTWAWGSALAMVPLGVLGTGLAYVLMVTLVGRVGAPRGSVAIYFTPVVAIVLGVLLRAEQVHPVAIAGTALVVGGAWLASRAEQPSRSQAPTPG